MFSKLGKEPLCNGHAERAPHIKEFCFPLCWRCLSIVIGASVGGIIIPNCFFHPTAMLFAGVALCVPCLIDGLVQRATDYESTNRKRCITGLLAGIGFSIFAYGLIGFVQNIVI